MSEIKKVTIWSKDHKKFCEAFVNKTGKIILETNHSGVDLIYFLKQLPEYKDR